MRTFTLAGVALGWAVAAQAGDPPKSPDTGTADRVAALIRQLGHAEFARREAAGQELAAVGDPALPALRRAAADHGDPEVRARAGKLVAALSFPELHCLRGHTSFVHAVAFSPDGRRALSGGRDKTVRLWDLQAGKEVRCLTGHEDTVFCVAFSPDGKRAVSGGNDMTLRVWDVETGAEVRCLRTAGGVGGLALSPDGDRALWGSSAGRVRATDLTTGKVVRDFRGHKDGPTECVHGVAVSRDGKLGLTGCTDNAVILWDLETGRALRRFTGHEDYVYGVALLPDGKRAVSGGYDHTVRLWDLGTGKELRRFRNHGERVWCLAVTPDGTRVLTGSNDGPARLWEVDTGRELHRFSLPRVGPPPGVTGRPENDLLLHCASVAVSPDGKHALAGGFDDTVRLWRLTP